MSSFRNNLEKLTQLVPRFDRSIYLFFIAVIVLGILVLLYQWNRKIDCADAVFYVHSDDYAVGSVIEFGDKTNNAKSWKWDFGDGATDFRQVTMHKYSQPGDYIVKLLINGTCYHEKLVSIGNYDVNPAYLPIIFSEDVASVGDIIYLEGQKDGGKTYEWSFGESGELDAIGPSVRTVYSTPGTKRITLIVNGDREHIATKEIYIAPRAPRIIKELPPDNYQSQTYVQIVEKETTPPDVTLDPLVEKIETLPSQPSHSIKKPQKIDNTRKCEDVSTDFLKRQINLVAKQSLTVDDIETYTSDGRNTKVLSLGKNNDVITLEQLCSEITNKKIEIKSFNVEKDANNCVKLFRINYRIKKSLLGLKKDAGT